MIFFLIYERFIFFYCESFSSLLFEIRRIFSSKNKVEVKGSFSLEVSLINDMKNCTYLFVTVLFLLFFLCFDDDGCSLCKGFFGHSCAFWRIDLIMGFKSQLFNIKGAIIFSLSRYTSFTYVHNKKNCINEL